MPTIKKIHCNTCNHETNHELLNTHDKDKYDVDYIEGHPVLDWFEKRQYGFWICRGCDTATLEERFSCMGMTDNNGDEIYSYTYYPERENTYIRKAKKFIHIDKKLNSIYHEVIRSYTLKLNVICSIGIRALLEGICITENITDDQAWGLNKKIEKLQSASNIPESIIQALINLKIIGDDAAHRLTATNDRQLNLAIDVLEALLTHLYEAKFDLEHKASLVKLADYTKSESPK